MVAGLLPPAIVLVDAGIDEPVGGLGGEQQMVDAEARIPLPAAHLIVPEGILRPRWMAHPQRVGEGDYSEGVIPPVRGFFRDETATLNQVFEMMVDKVRERTESLKQKISELQIMVDETKKDQHVREIVDSDFFRELQAKSLQMRNRVRPSSSETPTETTPES